MEADTGPIGGDLSHEFVILAETGESKIYSDKRVFDIDISSYNNSDNSIKNLRKKYDEYYAVTDDKFKKEDFEKKVKKENQLMTKGIEVGHIFYFGDKYSKPLKCSVDLKDGKKVNVKMGSYGVGVSRLVGAIIEAKFNNNIMRWPESVSPFEVVIVPSLQKKDKSNYLKAEKIYNYLIKNNIDVLLDDTDEHLSAKFKKFDLIGIPYQIILGSQSTEEKFEFKEVNGKSDNLSIEEIKKKLLNKRNSN
jgi:prolyl-tRNA synthetase